MIFNCVEPAYDGIGQDRYDWKFTVKPGFGHHIIFPHVDSCLAVVCQLANNSVFACHINGFYQNDYSAQSHQNAFAALLAELNGATVQRAAVFGNIGNGADLMGWTDFINFPWLIRTDFLSASCPNGIDVLMDVDSGVLKLMRYQANRNFRQIPPVDILRTLNVYTQIGYNLDVC